MKELGGGKEILERGDSKTELGARRMCEILVGGTKPLIEEKEEVVSRSRRRRLKRRCSAGKKNATWANLNIRNVKYLIHV